MRALNRSNIVASVIHRTSLQYFPSVNEPDFPEPTWKWNPSLAGVVGVPQKYWKAPADWNAVDAGPVEMTAPEKAVVDAAEAISFQLPKILKVELKLAGTTRTNTTTLAADPDLVFIAHPNESYLFRGFVLFDTTAAADFKFTIAGPTSPTAVRWRRHAIAPGATAYSAVGVATAFNGAGTAITGTGTTGGVIEFQGGLVNGSNQGNVAFSWAQNTADGGNTTVLKGSFIEWARVGG